MASVQNAASAADARVDAYIAGAAPPLQAVLLYLRDLVHEAVPSATETIKWGMPFFEFDGTILANMAAFQQHAAFGFWSKTMTEHLVAAGLTPPAGAGSFGKITQVGDLPPRRQLIGFLKTAAEHIRTGRAQSPMPRAAKRGPDGATSSKPAMETPAFFTEALAAAPAAKQTFDNLPPSCRREYLVWITEAKREETRTRRVQQAVAQLREGKRFNWQYETKR